MNDATLFLYDILNSQTTQVVLRILLAICFGALIGMEREHAHRPAGLRTHILVCVGACLVMLTSEFTYNEYHQFSPNMDINRLGAQVISGIGFLGAGTIIRNGSSVKGLTTAASVWAVACIGLATGVGFYLGATVCTLAIFIALSYVKNGAKSYETKKFSLFVTTSNPDVAVEIEKKLFSNSVEINNISLKPIDDNISSVSFKISANAAANTAAIVSQICTLPDISSVNMSEKESIKSEE